LCGKNAESLTKRDHSHTRNAMARWMNANEWTVDENEFYMVRMYGLLQRNLPVIDGLRFTRAESQTLVRLIQINRCNAIAVYAFAMLLRHGEYPLAMMATELWLGDALTFVRGFVCVMDCGTNTHIPGTDRLHAIHQTGIARQVFVDTQARCLHGGVIHLAMVRLLSALYVTANVSDGDWMRSQLFHDRNDTSPTQYIRKRVYCVFPAPSLNNRNKTLILAPTLSTISRANLHALLMHVMTQRRVDAWAYIIQSSSYARATFIDQCSVDQGAFFRLAMRWVCDKELTPEDCSAFQVDVVKDCIIDLSVDVIMQVPDIPL
jgi:hypothetical protein